MPEAVVQRRRLPARPARWPTARTRRIARDPDLQPRQRPGLRARHQLLRPRLPPDAGAARASTSTRPSATRATLPIYDSAANDFNFASIYTENAFSGNDRISDKQPADAGVTTRLIDPDTGAEAAALRHRAALASRDQLVTCPTACRSRERFSDLLLGASINWTPQWSARRHGPVQPRRRSRSARSTLGARYTPGPFRTVSAAYRY